jgi:phenylalanyl-tRNA synthetase beta chain
VTALLTRTPEAGLWDRERAPLFFEAKGVAERLFALLGQSPVFRAGAPESFLHPGAAGSFMVGNRVVGSVGELHPAVAAEFEIPVSSALVDVDLSVVADLPTQESQYRDVSRHPRAKRDLAVLLDREQPAGEIVEAIRKQGGAHLVGVEVFDRYEGTGVPDGKVSVAFRLAFQRVDRTLTDAEVTKATDKVVQMLSHRFGGKLR